MINNEAKVAPPYSLIFISDPEIELNVPADTGSELIAFTESCITIGTLSEVDGQTLVTLSGDEPAEEAKPMFTTDISTPSFRLAVSDANGQVILQTATSSIVTTVRIWVNDPTEPDKIWIQNI